MKRALGITLISIIAVCFIAACELLRNNNKERSDVLRPMSVGNWWEYQVRRPQWQDSIQDTVREIISDKIEITLGAEVYTVWGWKPDLDQEANPNYRWLSRNDKDGLFLMGGISATDSIFINELHYKYPAEVGDKWSVPQLSFSRSEHEFYVSDTLHITLVDKNRELKTPAGTFLCYVYNFDLSAGEDVLEKLDYYFFYDPGIGLVKQEERGKSDGRILSELILIGYEIN